LENRNWKKYTIEFLSIFIAVISAFALNNWNENNRDNRAESKILSEILNGLDKDIEDVNLNIMGHEQGVKSCKFWRRLFNGESVNTDTVQQYYFLLTRDFVSIQNTSGYEALKSRGLELVKNDSLRTKIISLYEYDYKTLMKLEEEYHELQFQENYFHEVNNIIAPNFLYTSDGNILGLELPLNIPTAQKKILLSYLWKIQVNRKFVLQSYNDVETKIKALKVEIAAELGR
jgi:hypothetical protein